MSTKTFYVCSYGGCGSKMLCQALKKFGNVEHIHSRNPPDKLEYIGNQKGGNTYCEWFNGIKIPEDEINNYYVIYIYKNPIKSILSRFHIPKHLDHVQSKKGIKIEDVIKTSKDLYDIKGFYNNYTKPNPNRNYKIYSVKYEEIFDKQDELSNALGIGKLNLVKKETNRTNAMNSYFEGLNNVYKDFIQIIKNNKFLMIN